MKRCLPFFRLTKCVWTLLFLIVAEVAVAQQSQELPIHEINDAELKAVFIKKLSKLQAAGKAVPATTLRTQLSRKSYSFSLIASAKTARQTPEELYLANCKRTLIVGYIFKVAGKKEWQASTSSGWVLSKGGLAVTNYHLLNTKRASQYMGIMTTGRDVFPVTEVLAANEAADILVLRTTGSNLFPVAIRANAPVATEVRVISHPKSRYYSYSQGHISRYYKVSRAGSVVTRMSISADYAQGSSGAPVFDVFGNLIGMASETLTLKASGKTEKDTQMVVKPCVPAVAILKMLRKK